MQHLAEIDIRMNKLHYAEAEAWCLASWPFDGLFLLFSQTVVTFMFVHEHLHLLPPFSPHDKWLWLRGCSVLATLETTGFGSLDKIVYTVFI